MTLLACGPSSPPDAGSEPDGGVTDGGADAVPMLDEALPCTPTPDTGVAEGDDLVRVTLSDPRAVCNDGTPAVMYVRRAASPDHPLKQRGRCIASVVAACPAPW